MNKSDIFEKYPPKMENLLLILHGLQDSNPRNYLSERDLTSAARHLDITLAMVYGVASYYTMFSLKPRGKHIIRICRSPVCHCAGITDIFAELSRILKIDVGATTSNKRFTLEATECLGQCDAAPAMTVDDVVYKNLTPEKIRAVIRHYGQQRHSAGRHNG